MSGEKEKDRSVSPSVLITGGSGLIGSRLTSVLVSQGFRVSHLTRSHGRNSKVRTFTWDPEKGFIDPAAFADVDFIVHLAGANIGEKRWSKHRRHEIISSRVDTARLIHKYVTEAEIPLKAFVSASATGYYGSVSSDAVFNESNVAAGDFLGSVCNQWEKAADLFSESGIRTVKIRTSVVLDRNDSALSKLMLPGKFGMLVKTGRGDQYMPWIHIDDLCSVYYKALSDESMRGAYNAAAPEQPVHTEFMMSLGRVMRRPVFPLALPPILLKMLMGEMATVVLEGSRVSPQKLLDAGFSFKFTDCESALNEIIKGK